MEFEDNFDEAEDDDVDYCDDKTEYIDDDDDDDDDGDDDDDDDEDGDDDENDKVEGQDASADMFARPTVRPSLRAPRAPPPPMARRVPSPVPPPPQRRQHERAMRKWDLDEFQALHPGSRVLIIGGTTCGKTTAMYQIAGAMHRNGKRMRNAENAKIKEHNAAQYANPDRRSRQPQKALKKVVGIQLVIGFSKTEKANGNLGGPIRDSDGNPDPKFPYALMPRWCAHHGFHEQQLRKFMDLQMDYKAVGRMKTAIVVMDDIMSQKGMKSCASLNEFMQNARNYGCGIIMSQHSIKQSSVDTRTQFHWVVCYEMASDQMKQFYDVFASRLFSSFAVFRNVWMQVTNKLGQYWALVINIQAKVKSNNPWDRVFKFRAEDPTTDAYKIPHIGEKGLWWLDKRIRKRAQAVDSSKLFNLQAVASMAGVALKVERAATGGNPWAAIADRDGRDDGGDDDIDDMEIILPDPLCGIRPPRRRVEAAPSVRESFR